MTTTFHSRATGTPTMVTTPKQNTTTPRSNGKSTANPSQPARGSSSSPIGVNTDDSESLPSPMTSSRQASIELISPAEYTRLTEPIRLGKDGGAAGTAAGLGSASGSGSVASPKKSRSLFALAMEENTQKRGWKVMPRTPAAKMNLQSGHFGRIATPGSSQSQTTPTPTATKRPSDSRGERDETATIRKKAKHSTTTTKTNPTSGAPRSSSFLSRSPSSPRTILKHPGGPLTSVEKALELIRARGRRVSLPLDEQQSASPDPIAGSAGSDDGEDPTAVTPRGSGRGTGHGKGKERESSPVAYSDADLDENVEMNGGAGQDEGDGRDGQFGRDERQGSPTGVLEPAGHDDTLNTPTPATTIAITTSTTTMTAIATATSTIIQSDTNTTNTTTARPDAVTSSSSTPALPALPSQPDPEDQPFVDPEPFHACRPYVANPKLVSLREAEHQRQAALEKKFLDAMRKSRLDGERMQDLERQVQHVRMCFAGAEKDAKRANARADGLARELALVKGRLKDGGGRGEEGGNEGEVGEADGDGEGEGEGDGEWGGNGAGGDASETDDALSFDVDADMDAGHEQTPDSGPAQDPRLAQVQAELAKTVDAMAIQAEAMRTVERTLETERGRAAHQAKRLVEVTTELESVRASLGAKAARVAELEQETTALRAKTKSQAESIEDRAVDLQTALAGYELLKGKRDKIQEDKVKVDEELAALKIRYADLEKTNESLDAENDELAEKVDLLERGGREELEQVEDELKDRQKELAEREKTIALDKARIVELERRVEQGKASVDGLEVKLSTVESSLAKEQTISAELHQRILGLDGELAVAREEAERMESVETNLRATSDDQKAMIDAAGVQIKSLKDQLAQASTAAETEKKRREEVEAEKRKAAAETLTLTGALESELTRATEAINGLENDGADLRAKMAEESSTSKLSIQNHQKRITELSTQLSASKKKVLELESTERQLRTAHTDLSTRTTNEIKSLRESETRLVEQVASLTRSAKQSAGEVTILSNKIESFNHAVVAAQNESAAKTTKIEMQQREIHSLAGKLESTVHDVDQKTLVIESLETRVQYLTEQLTLVNDQLGGQQKVGAELLQKISLAQSQYANQCARYKTLEGQLKRESEAWAADRGVLESTIKVEKKRVEQLESDRDGLRDEVERVKKEEEGVRADLTAHEEVIEKLVSLLGDLKKVTRGKSGNGVGSRAAGAAAGAAAATLATTMTPKTKSTKSKPTTATTAPAAT